MAFPELLTAGTLLVTPAQPGTIAQTADLDGLQGARNTVTLVLSEDEIEGICDTREDLYSRCLNKCVEGKDAKANDLREKGQLPLDYNRMKGMDDCRDGCAAQEHVTVRSFGIGECLPLPEAGKLTSNEADKVCAERVLQALAGFEPTQELMYPQCQQGAEGNFPMAISDKLWEDCLAALEQQEK